MTPLSEEPSDGPIADQPGFERRLLLKALGIGATLSFSSGAAAASSDETETLDPEQLVRSYGEMWNEQDYSKIPELTTESFVLINSSLPEGEIHGHEGLEEWMRQVASGFPDFQVEILDLLASEDTVMAEVIYTMTHEGEFLGIPPTEREVELPAMVKFLIEGDKIQEHRDYIDRLELFAQLGLTEAEE